MRKYIIDNIINYLSKLSVITLDKNQRTEKNTNVRTNYKWYERSMGRMVYTWYE